MEVIQKGLTLSFSLVIFIASSLIAIPNMQEINEGFNSSAEPVNDVLSEQLKIPKKPSITGAAVRSKLYAISKEKIPIVVDGVRYENDSDVIGKDLSHIVLNQNYIETVQRNGNGEIIQITYTKER